MSLVKKSYEFATGQELLGFLHQEKKPLAGSVVVYDYQEYDHPVTEEAIPGEFILTVDPRSREEVAVFNPNKAFSNEYRAEIISPNSVAVDGLLGYVRSRKTLKDK